VGPFLELLILGLLSQVVQSGELWAAISLAFADVGPVGFEPMKLWVQQDGKGLGWESERLEGIVSLGPRSD
jgi:hypothetical protein